MWLPFKRYSSTLKKTGIQKTATVHTLRHSFATHLLEAGVDIFTIQNPGSGPGHASLQATSVYIHIQRRNFGKITNPLDRLWEEEP